MIKYAHYLENIFEIFPSMKYEISSSYIAGKIENYSGNLSFIVDQQGYVSYPEYEFGTDEEKEIVNQVLEQISSEIKSKKSR